MEKDWLLRVRNLSVRFNSRKGTVHAVDDVSFDIAAGETLALVGETGCGKSVTARSILRLVPEPPGQYWSGQIGLRNADGSIVDILAASMDKVLEIRGERISMIFQDPGKALNPALQISRQLAEVFAQHRLQMIFADAGLDFSTATKLDKKFIMQRLNGVQSRAYALLRKARASALEKAMANAVEQALADTGIPNPKKVMISYP